MVVAPLFHAGESVGVLKILSDCPSSFGECDLQTLQIMAGLLGAVIGHQEAFEKNRLHLEVQSVAIIAMENEAVHRRQVKKAVRANEMRTRQIIEGSHDPFIAMNVDGIITEWNEAAYHTFGWSRSQALGQRLDELIMPHRFREAHHTGMQRFIASGSATILDKRIELIALRQSGEEFPVEITIRHMRHAGVTEFCAFARDITERRAAEEHLKFLAHNDPMTGLPNRSLLQDRLAEAIKRSGRAKTLLAVMFLDVDHFKSINDHYGHGVGDAVPQEFARRMLDSVRATDTVARLGGDEFIILMEDLTSNEDAGKIAHKVHQRMSALFVSSGQHTIAVTTSIGLAPCAAGGVDATALLKAADDALYRAKQARRNGTQT